MVYIHCSRSFCCLPVRFGVFLCANLGLAGGALFSTASWLQIALLTRHPLATQDQISLYIQAAVYTLLAIVSLIGMLGSIFRRLSTISLYTKMLLVHLILSLASGGFSFYSFFRNASDDVTKCINGSTDEATKALCGKGWSVVRGVTVGLFVFLWLIQIYTFVLVDNLRENLDMDAASEMPRSKITQNISSPIPQAVSNSYTKSQYPHPYDIRPERSCSHFSDF